MKLVRDNIPQKIIDSNGNCAYAVCADNELLKRLLENKLFEEAEEFIEFIEGTESYDLFEAADIVTIIYYLMNKKREAENKEPYTLNTFFSDLQKATHAKLNSNGGFEKGYILLDREDYTRD